MKTHLLMLVTLFAVGALAIAPEARACNGYGYGYGIGHLYRSLENRVPHFAAHPPVYYSYPVPRTYGYSPFAYPPHVQTPEVEQVSAAPIEITNPYVPSTRQEPPAADQTAQSTDQTQPLVILNPFVTGRSVASVE